MRHTRTVVVPSVTTTLSRSNVIKATGPKVRAAYLARNGGAEVRVVTGEPTCPEGITLALDVPQGIAYISLNTVEARALAERLIIAAADVDPR